MKIEVLHIIFYTKLHKKLRIGICHPNLSNIINIKTKKSKWITFGIIKSIKYKDNLYTTLKLTDSNSMQFAIYKTNFDTSNNILNKSIRLAKRHYYQLLLAKFKCDIKGTWKTINEILNRTKHKIKFPLFFNDGENLVTSKELIANKFNTFFTNIGSKLSRQIKRPKNKSFKDYLISNNNQFKFQITNN